MARKKPSAKSIGNPLGDPDPIEVEAEMFEFASTASAGSQDDPDVDYKVPRKFRIGKTRRNHRLKEAFYAQLRQVRRDEPDQPEEQQRALAWRQVDELLPRNDRVFDQEEQKLALYFRTPQSTLIHRMVQVAMVFCLPEIRWLISWLVAFSEGRPAIRDKAAACLLIMAFAKRTPEVLATYEAIDGEANASLAWAANYPRCSQKTYGAFLRQIEQICQRKNPRHARHMTVEFMTQLAEIPSRRGRDAGLMYPEIFRYLVVDATSIEADFAQRPWQRDYDGQSVNESEHAIWARGDRFRMVRFIRYEDPKTRRETFRAVGWKWLQIIDGKTGLPVIGKLVPATNNRIERWETIALLRELFHLSPLAGERAQFLIGDALYSGDWRGDDWRGTNAFTRELYVRWGLHLVAPIASDKDPSPTGMRGGEKQREKLGVPVCECGELMKRVGWERVWSAADRHAAGIPRGQEVPDDARCRWRCPQTRYSNGRYAGGCNPKRKFKYTEMRTLWAVHTFLPHTGDSRQHKQRIAMYLMRLRIESVFAQLKTLGVGAKANQRAEWTGDAEMEWVINLAMMFFTARAVAHRGGHYQWVRGWAERFGLTTSATYELPNPGPRSSDAVDEWRAARDARFGPMRPPRTLTADGHERTSLWPPVLAYPEDDDGEELLAA